MSNEADYWRTLYETEHQQRLEIEDALQQYMECERSERLGQFVTLESENEECVR